MQNLKKLIGSFMIAILLIAITPVAGQAEWKSNDAGWWYTEGNSYAQWWKQINGKWYYFGQDGYMKIGWLQDSNKKWYYLNLDGSMAHDTTIDGYTIGSDGTWNQSTQSILSNVNLNATTISGVTGINFDDITKIVFYDGMGGQNKPVMVEDKQKIKQFMRYLDDYSIKKTENPESAGWIHSAIFYINDKEVMNITFVNPIIINGDYFNVTKGELDTETIGKFLKLIDDSYNIMAGL